MRSICARLLASLLMLCVISPIHAADLPTPDGEVLLKISGNIKNTNVDGEAWFDLAMLKSIGVTEIKTESPWTESIADYSGVAIKDLMDTVGAESGDFTAYALNKYEFNFSKIDFKDYPVIIAWEQNSVPLTVRTLGPLWIMFPYTDYPEIDNEKHRNAAVWQLVSLVVN